MKNICSKLYNAKLENGFLKLLETESENYFMFCSRANVSNIFLLQMHEIDGDILR